MDLHGRIMNIEAKTPNDLGEVDGIVHAHRDARHAAAELALKADTLADALRMYVAAGIGNSTDIAKQLDAHTAAMQALREYEA